MADADELNEGEEPPAPKRVVKVGSAADYAQLMADTTHEKVVCLVWLRAGDRHCATVLPWLKAAQEDPLYEHVLLLQCDPQALRDVAAEHELFCVPTFHFYWHGAKLHTFSGSNQLKFQAYLKKTLQARLAELSIPKAWQRAAEPEATVARGGSLQLTNPPAPPLTLGVGWAPGSQEDAAAPEVFVVLAGDGGKAVSEDLVVKGDHLAIPSGAVRLMEGSGKAGEDGADNISLVLDFAEIDVEIWEILIILYLPEAKEKELTMAATGETFYVRLYSRGDNRVLFRYDVEEDASGENSSIVAGKFVREQGVWGFQALGDPGDLDLEELKERFIRTDKKKKKKK